MSWGVSIEYDTKEAERKLGAQARDRGQYAMGNQMLADMTMYVPMKEGSLRQSGHMSEDNDWLIWDTPYAKAQFYGSNGIANFSNYTTPGTGKRWDNQAKGNHMNDWKKAWLKGAGF